MNIESVLTSKFVCLEADSLDPETDKASEIFANVCETIFQRGLVSNIGSLSSCSSCITQQVTSTSFTQDINAKPRYSNEHYFQERKETPLHSELKKIGHLGHPIIIEFIIVPKSEVENQDSFPSRKHIPGYLVEQWMIQFLPKRFLFNKTYFKIYGPILKKINFAFYFRLVTDTLSNIPDLLNEINTYCKLSVVNKVVFGDRSSDCPSQLESFSCVCRWVFSIKISFFIYVVYYFTIY